MNTLEKITAEKFSKLNKYKSDYPIEILKKKLVYIAILLILKKNYSTKKTKYL